MATVEPAIILLPPLPSREQGLFLSPTRILVFIACLSSSFFPPTPPDIKAPPPPSLPILSLALRNFSLPLLLLLQPLLSIREARANEGRKTAGGRGTKIDLPFPFFPIPPFRSLPASVSTLLSQLFSSPPSTSSSSSSRLCDHLSWVGATAAAAAAAAAE